MAKTIMVVLDGCTYEGATAHMGFLEHLCEAKIAAKYRIKSELPAMSRPLYETLLTGLPVSKHGVVNNLVVRPSQAENIFSLCKKAGYKTGASAYFWMSELYHKAPFDYIEDRRVTAGTGCIDEGIFYYEDAYPDSHVFIDGEWIRKELNPEFLLVHSMNIDYAGHLHGGNSKGYNDAIVKADVLLSSCISLWMNLGYEIVVTADHGMNEQGSHCGNTEIERTVPLYVISKKVKGGDYTKEEKSQLVIAPLLCKLLEIPVAQGMIALDEWEGQWDGEK